MTNSSGRPSPLIEFFSVPAVLIAGVLLTAFIPIPRSMTASNLPWKVELVTGILCIYFAYRSYAEGVTVKIDANVRRLLLLGALFTAWSAFSILWASSAGWAIHHTLTWAAYLAVFAFSTAMIRRRGLSDILTAFSIVALILGISVVLDFALVDDFLNSQGAIRIRYAKFAEMALTISPLLGAAALYGRRRSDRILMSIAWLVSWMVVMLSLSKGAFLSGIIAHLVLFAGCLLLSEKLTRAKIVRPAVIWLVFTIVIQAGFSFFSSIPSTTDYISGAADRTRETTTFRTFVWRIGTYMVIQHPLVGVGADNFGIAFNDSRKYAAAARSQTPGLEIAEDYMVERAHNEPLQMLAELGVVGIGLILAAGLTFLYISWLALKRRRYRMSPVFWGSFAGAVGFLSSSMVSSFSFRAIQNGIAFFIVLAVGVVEISKALREKRIARAWNLTPYYLAIGILLSVFAGSKALAEYQLYRAERIPDLADASGLYRSALAIDRDNATAHYYFAARLASQGNDYALAADHLRRGIDRGIGVSLTYVLLSEYQDRAGDRDAARASLAEAVSIFPNSVYARVRYAEFLSANGETAAAEDQIARAMTIDPRQAAGWQAIVREGSVAAFHKAESDPQVAHPAELLPAAAVLQYVDKDRSQEP